MTTRHRKHGPVTSAAPSVSLQMPAWWPAGARVVRRQGANAIAGEARIDRRPLARLLWTSDGQLAHEMPLDAKGRNHGVEIERDDQGQIAWCAQWVHGKQHGLVMQFDRRGHPVLVTEFVGGVGTDLWMTCGIISEVRECTDRRLHGLVRWGDPRRPWEEEHYHRGQRHGIFRTWDDDKLANGFPCFYLKGKVVSRRAYEAAQAKDASLPPYDKRDDSNRRAMPPVVRDALDRAKALRRELRLVEEVRRRLAMKDVARPPRG